MGNRNLFTLIPKIDELLEKDEIKELMRDIPRITVVDTIREEIEDLRGKIKNGISEEEIESTINNLPSHIQAKAQKKDSYKLKRCINATGVVIHTNLGRSLINKKIMENVLEVASHYSNLEFDLEKGQRGSRYSHLEEIIKDVVGGEAAMVVNNNAAAVMLVLSTMAKGKEVIVSRGELIEIGGSFRIPDVMSQSGANLVEVGTTNKTHLWDYEKAITENTAALLKVHTSNYRVVGFTSAVDSEELSVLKEKYDIPIIEDLGSGVLVDLSKYSLEYENTVQDSLKRGVDVVTFSGDKLLGGPQAGVIVGKKKFIDACKKNPLTRAFRVDKFTIAALEGTLKYYLDEKKAMEEIPTLRMLTMTKETLNKKSRKLKELIENNIDSAYIEIEIEDSYSEVGGGSLPTERIPTKCVVLDIKKISINSFEENLRHYDIPLIARLNKDRVYLDVRTIEDEEIELVVKGIKYALGVED
ncbi:L-seryl-tRNA(Sec) selenium transferase [Tissierella creatinini]|nr:L-seryl-tRNA(Sec) selenium transferase [Tissierella creatinini]TJX67200.1 L-seryl-tRNA(Sec) selenium transferase [Soehngenia saccharolytica]